MSFGDELRVRRRAPSWRTQRMSVETADARESEESNEAHESTVGSAARGDGIRQGGESEGKERGRSREREREREREGGEREGGKEEGKVLEDPRAFTMLACTRPPFGLAS